MLHPLADAGLFTLACVFVIVACFGGVAGVVSGFLLRKGADAIEVDPTMLSPGQHLANFLVGVVGSFAFVPFGARILDLEFVHVFNHARLEDTLKCTLFLISLAIIGGFAGYRGLAALTDKMLAKVNELDSRTQDLEKAKARLDSRTEDLESAKTRLDARTQDLEQAKARLESLNRDMDERAKKQAAFDGAFYAKMMKDEDIVAAATAITKSLETYPTKLGEFVNALIYRRKKRYDQAIAALDRALDLPTDEYFSNNASIYWNKACYLAISAPERQAEIIWNLDRSIEIKPRYRDDVAKDPDLRPLLDKPDFAQHFQPT